MARTALITGGSHNIGQGIAVVLAEKGYDVAITYHRRLDGAEETRQKVEALGRTCLVYQASLEDADVPEKTVCRAWRDLGYLDLLVCNAGIDARHSILTVSRDDLSRFFNTNYCSYILCAGTAARQMVKDGIRGNIVFITSTRAERAYPDDFVYGGFKAAIRRACESIALDLSAYGIRVNCVAPGATWLPQMIEKRSDFENKSIPLHRSGTPRDVGEAVAFVAGDEASYITGTTVRVDGGLILPGMLEGQEAVPWVRPEWQRQHYENAIKLAEQERLSETPSCVPNNREGQ